MKTFPLLLVAATFVFASSALAAPVDWRNDPNNPKNAPYSKENNPLNRHNSVSNPSNASTSQNRININIPSISILGVTLTSKEGYAVDYDPHVSLFSDEGYIGFCNRYTRYAPPNGAQNLPLTQTLSYAAAGTEVTFPEEQLPCFDREGNPIEPKFSLNR